MVGSGIGEPGSGGMVHDEVAPRRGRKQKTAGYATPRWTPRVTKREEGGGSAAVLMLPSTNAEIKYL